MCFTQRIIHAEQLVQNHPSMQAAQAVITQQQVIHHYDSSSTSHDHNAPHVQQIQIAPHDVTNQQTLVHLSNVAPSHDDITSQQTHHVVYTNEESVLSEETVSHVVQTVAPLSVTGESAEETLGVDVEGYAEQGVVYQGVHEMEAPVHTEAEVRFNKT